MKALSFIYSFFNCLFNKTAAFLNNYFEVTSTKRSKIIGTLIATISFLGVLLRAENFIEQEFASKNLLLIFAFICPFIIWITATYTVRIKSELFNKIWHFVFFLLMPFIIITMT